MSPLLPSQIIYFHLVFNHPCLSCFDLSCLVWSCLMICSLVLSCLMMCSLLLSSTSPLLHTVALAHDRQSGGELHRGGVSLAAGRRPALPEHCALQSAVPQLVHLVRSKQASQQASTETSLHPSLILYHSIRIQQLLASNSSLLLSTRLLPQEDVLLQASQFAARCARTHGLQHPAPR